MARIGPGVRNKPRILQDICADCGATGWSNCFKIYTKLLVLTLLKTEK